MRRETQDLCLCKFYVVIALLDALNEYHMCVRLRVGCNDNISIL